MVGCSSVLATRRASSALLSQKPAGLIWSVTVLTSPPREVPHTDDLTTCLPQRSCDETGGGRAVVCLACLGAMRRRPFWLAQMRDVGAKPDHPMAMGLSRSRPDGRKSRGHPRHAPNGGGLRLALSWPVCIQNTDDLFGPFLGAVFGSNLPAEFKNRLRKTS